jgi:hypothetical protein
MSGVTCGVWPMRGGRLAAVVVDEDGRPSPPLVLARTDEGCWGLLEHLSGHVGLDCTLVLPAWLAKSDRLAHLALAYGFAVWVAPPALVDAARVIVGAGPPRRWAAAIARLPLTALREHLHRSEPADRSQLTLW